MKRVFVTTFFGLIAGAIFQGLAIFLPDYFNGFLLPPLILVFSLQYFRPKETIALAFSCGILTDVFLGIMIGQNTLLMLIFAFGFGSTTLFAGRKSPKTLSFYVLGMSLLYRIFLLLFQIVFSMHLTTSFSIFIFGPVIDWFLSFIFFSFLVRSLVLSKVFDPYEYFRPKIGPLI